MSWMVEYPTIITEYSISFTIYEYNQPTEQKMAKANKRQKQINSLKALERMDRIDVLGGFGKNKVKVVESKKTYNRRKANELPTI